MEYKELGQAILEKLGGKDNVIDLTHCATRLRFTLVSDQKVDQEGIKSLDGVIGAVANGGQYQVVIGNDVEKVYRPLVNSLEGQVGQSHNVNQNQGLLATILATISGIFTPILPVITAAGMIKAVLSLLTVFGVVTANDTNYQILNFIGDAGFYFLPIFLGGTAARQFKTNQYLGMLVGAILIHPTFVGLITTAKEAGKGLEFFHLPITLSSYSSTVIPVILAVWFMSYVERLADKLSPKSIKFFSVPLLTSLVTAVITLIVIGPIGAVVGSWLGNFFLWLEEFGPWVVPTIVGTVSPFLVMTGTHYGLVSIGINNRMTIGYDTIAQPGMFPSNIAQGGAALAIALKTKDVNKRALASSAGVTAIFGITEPALYGVTLQNKAALVATMIAGGFGGFFMGIMGARNFSGGSPGLLTIAAYIGEDTLRYFHIALIGFALSVVISFVLTWLLYNED